MRYQWVIEQENEKKFRLTIYSWRWPSGTAAMMRSAREDFYVDWSQTYRTRAKAELGRDQFFNGKRTAAANKAAAVSGEVEI